MRAFNVEFFDKNYNLKYHNNINDVAYANDYLSPSENSVDIPDGDIKKGYYIRIVRGDEVYFGVVTKVEDNTDDNLVTVTFGSFLNLFNYPILFDTDQQGVGTLENCIKSILTYYWVSNADLYQNIPGLVVNTTTSTTAWGFNLKSDTEGVHHLVCNFFETFIIRAMQKYYVGLTVDFDPTNHQIIVNVGVNTNTPKVVEADLANVIKKNIVIKETGNDINKLVVINTTDYSGNKITYYKHNDKTYSQVNSDRIEPVIFEFSEVTPDEENTFASLAAKEAEDKFAEADFNNLIELSVLSDDDLVKPGDMRLGQEVNVIHNGKMYNSILTGKEIDSGTTKLIFGTIRLELTKSLRRLS